MASYPDRAVDLAQTFAEVARSLLAEGDVQHTLDKVAQLAVSTIDGCDHAGISVVEGKQIITKASSDEVARQVDSVQHETGEGPCPQAIKDHEVIRVADLRQEQRWPRFAKRANEVSGVVTMLSYRLFAAEDTMGALNLYSRRPNAFSDEDVEVASVFAAHAAVAMAHARQEDNLRRAIQTRDLIGRAKGMLMARQGITDEEAFDLLRRASQRLNLKLREIAERVTTTSSASPPPPPPQ